MSYLHGFSVHDNVLHTWIDVLYKNETKTNETKHCWLFEVKSLSIEWFETIFNQIHIIEWGRQFHTFSFCDRFTTTFSIRIRFSRFYRAIPFSLPPIAFPSNKCFFSYCDSSQTGLHNEVWPHKQWFSIMRTTFKRQLDDSWPANKYCRIMATTEDNACNTLPMAMTTSYFSLIHQRNEHKLH